MTVFAPAGLCTSCSFMKRVTGRRGQAYTLCRNNDLPVRYPSLPVQACAGYANVIENAAT